MLTIARHKMPNVRKCFIPDPGYEICEADLAQADAQVVAWEADAPKLKEIFKTKQDLHTTNAEMIWGTSSNKDLNAHRRQLAKAGCHLTNYGGQARTCARALGITVHEAEQFQRRWFSIHPEILAWHRRIQSDLECNRRVRNAFGYQRIYFCRIEDAFTEALAWIPQSTVALIITKALNRMHTEYPHLLQILLQVHDSTLTQYEVSVAGVARQAVKDCMHVVVPYPDPLIIPSDVSVSTKSWGDVARVS